MIILLIVLLVAFAAAGGFLADFLELAGIFILILALIGLIIGVGVAAAVRRVLGIDQKGRT